MTTFGYPPRSRLSVFLGLTALVFACCTLDMGCSGVDERRLKNTPAAGTGQAGTQSGAGGPAAGTVPVGGTTVTAGTVSPAPNGGTGPAGSGTGGGTGNPNEDAGVPPDGGVTPGCEPNPDVTDQVCTEICPEACNGKDDDCDLRIDEGTSSACDAPHATAVCTRGTCVITACDADHRDCDGQAVSGCEVDIATDPDHCGGCGDACKLEHTETIACSGGFVCAVDTCQDGFGDCDGNDATGCETPVNTLSNCGGCSASGDAQPCEDLPQAVATDCSTGTCRVTECETDWEDCDGEASNGCEEMIGPTVCGCDDPSADNDDDGTPDCTDECDGDPDKTAAGVCGCRVPDTDSDDDGTPDCVDMCDGDADKIVPGACGCGVADTDSDDDEAPDCHDGCPSDPTVQGECFPFTHGNVDTDPIDFSAQPTATIDCGDVTIDTTNPDGLGPLVATIDGWCGTPPKPMSQKQTSGLGPNVVVIPLRGLTVESGRTITVIGDRPLVFAVRGNVDIAGTITANASGMTPGAGGNLSCEPATAEGAGSNGAGSSRTGGGGGGGGGFGTAGGNGGDGGGGGFNGVGGATRGSARLVPLRGGCQGGRGGGCSANGAAGGGAIQITASGSLTISGSLTADGGDGQTGCGSEGGGTGGGSGGGLLLEANSVDLTGATFTANGGRGGNGRSGTSGASGSTSPSASGGTAWNEPADGGGGGGGGYGRLHVNYVTACTACP